MHMRALVSVDARCNIAQRATRLLEVDTKDRKLFSEVTRMFRFVPLLVILLLSPAQAQIIDQKTYDLVLNMARSQAASHGLILEFYGIESVSIVGLDSSVDMAKVEELPSKIEERIFTAINCDASPQEFDRTLTVETNKTTTVEISETIG